MAAPLGNVLRKRIFNISLRKGRCLHAGKPHCNEQSMADRFREASKAQRPLCRTLQADPAHQSQNHKGLYYTVPDEYAQKFFNKGQRPHLLQMFKAFNETSVMIRKPALEVIDCLKNANYNFPTIRYLLYGPKGGGKSVTLGHIMQYCSLNDWLVVHIPWVPRFTRMTKEPQLSTFRPGRVDLPVECLEWLYYFQQMNSAFLSKHNPTVEGEYTWTKRDQTLPGTPWQDVINFATERPKSSNDIMNVLLKEIKQQASQKKFKVLIAIDGVNNCWQPTLIKREEDKRFKYEPHEISVIHNIKKLLSNNWKNGAVVCTVDKVASIPDHSESDLPMYLLQQEGFELFDPFLPIHVGNYTDKEVYSNIEYFADRKWIQNPQGLTDDGKKELVFLSCKNPFELYRVTQSW